MHEMRAEHGPVRSGDDRPVDYWHVVASGADVALCGLEIHRDSAVQPVRDDGEPAAERYCETCLAEFRRKVVPVNPAAPAAS
ncbi:hypothetical protein LO771_23010 [Streptacidiphilus sp. ASG 303]|uniref:hypothetical protein n=1 Tax=Streptacidiphilus sp. ASG 303 TaxID=2896847 RepID=UPI001E5DB04C|nr:hypothetical protein [Streptacidiphilus sp. ASG 303]MCD0485173.1 hypothetical protein [Streptacidiphilus sp. ASG 303]